MSEADPLNRREFVKIGVAAGAAAAAGGIAFGSTVIVRREWGVLPRTFQYLGAKRVGGPADRAVPLIPLRKNANGDLEGVPALAGVEPHHGLHWYRYCAHDAAPGLQPDYPGDNVLRYFANPATLQGAERELGHALWYADRIGQPVRPEHFENPRDGAGVSWRSQDQTDTSFLFAHVVRVDRTAFQGPVPDGFMVDDLVAMFAACTHFCCKNGYRESKVALAHGSFDMLFCTCHDSVFDPHRIVVNEFRPGSR